jgi:hypothetical protein
VSLAHDLTLHLIGRLYGEAARDEVACLIEYDRAFAANRAALGIVVAGDAMDSPRPRRNGQWSPPDARGQSSIDLTPKPVT